MQPGSSTLELLERAKTARKQNQIQQAKEAYEQALTLEQDCLEAHAGLAELRFPGDHYLTVLARIHERLRPKAYVEIGLGEGASLAQALPTTRCIGIDPDPNFKAKIPPTAELYMMPSNDFFVEYDLGSILEGRPLELGFIDGLHVFDQVIDDFINLERFCDPNGTILMHDCMPINALTASRERQTQFWTGDVWRALPTLARFRPDLTITAVGSYPSGLAIVRKLDPTSNTLANAREKVVAFGAGLDFRSTESLPDFGIQVLPSNWDVVSRIF